MHKFVALKRYFLLSVFFACLLTAHAQYGGNGVFAILKQPVNGRQAAWGGYYNAYRTGDANTMLANPALLGRETDKRASMNFNTQFKGLWSGNGAFSMKIKDIGYFGAAISYMDYGTMKAYDAGGNAEGTTSANETLFALGYANEAKHNISYGANFKIAYSVLGPYVANGFMFDAGVTWRKKDSVVTVGAVLKNAGMMLGTYGDTKREKLPFQAEVGVNFKPLHMPFRFNMVMHDLQRFDLTYNQYLQTNNTIDLNGDAAAPKEAKFGDKVLRHFTVGTELVLGKHFGIMVGYNHQRRREMAPEVKAGVTGFSWGINLRISKILITYSSACYFPGFSMNLFTFSTGLNDFKKKPASSQTGAAK